MWVQTGPACGPGFSWGQAPGKLRHTPTSPETEARPCRRAAVDTCPKRLLNGLQDPDSLLQGPCTQRHRKDHRTPCRLIAKFLQLFNTSILFLLEQKLVSVGQTTIMTGRVRTCFEGAGLPRLEENSGTWRVLPFGTPRAGFLDVHFTWCLPLETSLFF